MPVFDLTVQSNCKIEGNDEQRALMGIFNHFFLQRKEMTCPSSSATPLKLLLQNAEKNSVELDSITLQHRDFEVANSSHDFGTHIFEISRTQLKQLKDSETYLPSYLPLTLFVLFKTIFEQYSYYVLIPYLQMPLKAYTANLALTKLIESIEQNPKDYGYHSLLDFQRSCFSTDALSYILSAIVKTRLIRFILDNEYHLTSGQSEIIELNSVQIYIDNNFVEKYFNISSGFHSLGGKLTESCFKKPRGQEHLIQFFTHKINVMLSALEKQNARYIILSHLTLNDADLGWERKPAISKYLNSLYYSILFSELNKYEKTLSVFINWINDGLKEALDKPNHSRVDIYLNSANRIHLAYSLTELARGKVVLENVISVAALLSDSSTFDPTYATARDEAYKFRTTSESTASASHFYQVKEKELIELALPENKFPQQLVQIETENLVPARKQAINLELDQYISSWKLSIFGHHHNERAKAVRTAVNNANTLNEIKEILLNQLGLFTYQSQPTTQLDARWSEGLRNRPTDRRKSGYFQMLGRALNACPNDIYSMPLAPYKP